MIIYVSTSTTAEGDTGIRGTGLGLKKSNGSPGCDSPKETGLVRLKGSIVG